MMAKQLINNIKLGIFTLSGLMLLILLLYMIGKNQHMFGSNFTLRADFENVQGLKTGNNVRYAGIDVGTVKKVIILSDTLVEVVMIIDEKMEHVIRKNAVVSIGTDGLVGNKVVNITAVKQTAAEAADADVLASKKPVDTDEMLRTLSKTNSDIAIITDNLKTTVSRINNSSALWNVLNDKGLPQNLKLAAVNIRTATARASDMINELHGIVSDVKEGKGSVGVLLKDTAFAYQLNEAVIKIKQVGVSADSLSSQLTGTIAGIGQEINHGKGTVHALLKDSLMAVRIGNSLDNIQKGTDGFNQNMEAIKHSFLFRGYFKRQERRKQKAAKEQVVVQ
jgi:phospholipid/cholesterol/gamma-HCH transport system substrate-binding protein